MIQIGTAWIVLTVLVVAYVPILFWVMSSPKAKEMGFSLRGPIVMFKTQRGRDFMDRIGSKKRLCSAFGLFSKIVSAVLMAVMVFFMLTAMVNLPAAFSSGTTAAALSSSVSGILTLRNLVFAVIGLIVAMIIHEFAHGIQARANGIRVESSGAIYAVVPLGAFVEMNVEDVDKSSNKSKMNVFSAGVSVNFVAAVVSFLIFAVLMLGSVGTAAGIDNGSPGVYSVSADSPASGIPAGAIIESIDGIDVYTVQHDGFFVLSEEDFGPGEHIVQYRTQDGTFIKNMILGLYVVSVVPNSPAADAGIAAGTVITGINDTHIGGVADFRDFVSSSHPGQKVKVTYIDGMSEETTGEFELGSKDGVGFFGISTNYSGLSIVTPEHVLGTAAHPAYGVSGFVPSVLKILGYTTVAFGGYSPVPSEFRWWYDVPGGEAFWLTAGLFFWMFWCNILLGITNALPAIPFDGGYLFRGWTGQFLERIGYGDEETRKKTADNISRAVSGFMIFLLILVVIAMIF
ncbi:MAG: site-2 protease family protein [Candidatus Methanomethylophilaceae archaeon]|jgi:membrane-associated protease RseP (regulator of RpoE activity)